MKGSFAQLLFMPPSPKQFLGSRDPYNLLGNGAGFVLCWKGNPEVLIGQRNQDSELIQVISQSMIMAIPEYAFVDFMPLNSNRNLDLSRMKLHPQSLTDFARFVRSLVPVCGLESALLLKELAAQNALLAVVLRFIEPVDCTISALITKCCLRRNCSYHSLTLVVFSFVSQLYLTLCHSEPRGFLPRIQI
jgi:hypothetical protein